MEARIAKPGKTLKISYYWVANFKFDEINTEFKLENQKNLNHCNIRFSLNVKKILLFNMQKYYVKKLKHGEIVKLAFKYIIIDI